jgi:hypothetical protein
METSALDATGVHEAFIEVICRKYPNLSLSVSSLSLSLSLSHDPRQQCMNESQVYIQKTSQQIFLTENRYFVEMRERGRAGGRSVVVVCCSFTVLS